MVGSHGNHRMNCCICWAQYQPQALLCERYEMNRINITRDTFNEIHIFVNMMHMFLLLPHLWKLPAPHPHNTHLFNVKGKNVWRSTTKSHRSWQSRFVMHADDDDAAGDDGDNTIWKEQSIHQTIFCDRVINRCCQKIYIRRYEKSATLKPQNHLTIFLK